jgi:ATP phosphoribosyltransferase regulatory subunit
MLSSTPSGTRDVLPDEMRELRAIGDALRRVFDEHGYGEVATSAVRGSPTARRTGSSTTTATSSCCAPT